ncbi:unnamed protein product [Gongylonema pulchrum]|uniref:3'-5' exonuclease domain-containing protein n=1 Tax=Gongylonema pulchrum TaxID=637853 RepID=A0A183DFG1_9BILA|nr:unnamed protein product [Gongylonema pulchrum]
MHGIRILNEKCDVRWGVGADLAELLYFLDHFGMCLLELSQDDEVALHLRHNCLRYHVDLVNREPDRPLWYKRLANVYADLCEEYANAFTRKF